MSMTITRMSDADLVIWSTSFSKTLAATPEVFNVTAQQAAVMSDLSAQFEAAVAVWREPASRTPVASANKSAIRAKLLGRASYLVNSINSNPDTTDAQRTQLDIRGRKKGSPIDRPRVAPLVDVASVDGRVATVVLHATEGGRRGKPAGAAGANVFSFVGDEPPADFNDWLFEGMLTKTRFELNFEQSAGSNTAWVTANWYNEKGQTGPAGAVVRIDLPAVRVLPQDRKMKLAA